MNRNEISIPFHWSGGMVATTIITLFFIAGTSIFLVLRDIPSIMLPLIAVFIIVILGCVYYMPLRLKADNKKITQTRLFGSLEIPIKEITEIRNFHKSELQSSIRTFGSGGLFGFLGKFWNKRTGHYIMYATELKNLILISTDKKKYVFSCSRPKEFMEFVNSRK